MMNAVTIAAVKAAPVVMNDKMDNKLIPVTPWTLKQEWRFHLTGISNPSHFSSENSLMKQICKVVKPF